MLEVDRRYYVTTEKSGTTDLSDEIGAFKAHFEPWEDIWHGFRNGEPFQKEIYRKPGVYLPEKRVNGGTLVQNDHELLREAVEAAAAIADRAARDGWRVFGVGKNHDNTMQVFADTSEYDVDGPAHFKGANYLGAGPYRGCTVMGIPLKWWEHYDDEPAIEISEIDLPEVIDGAPD